MVNAKALMIRHLLRCYCTLVGASDVLPYLNQAISEPQQDWPLACTISEGPAEVYRQLPIHPLNKRLARESCNYAPAGSFRWFWRG